MVQARCFYLPMKHDYECLRPGIYLRQDPRLKLTTDALLLAAFCHPPHGASIADLGCGSGAISLLLCAADPTCHLTGIECDGTACALAEDSRQASQLTDRFSVVQCDLRRCRTKFSPGSFDYAVANPPYFPTGTNSARAEQVCTLQELCNTAAYLVKNGGTFSMIYRPERLTDALCALRAAHLEPKRIQFVRHQVGTPINLVLLSAKHGGHSGLQFEPDRILHQSHCCDSTLYSHKED